MVYSPLPVYLGFEVNEGEYKSMGLAPYDNQIRKGNSANSLGTSRAEYLAEFAVFMRSSKKTEVFRRSL